VGMGFGSVCWPGAVGFQGGAPAKGFLRSAGGWPTQAWFWLEWGYSDLLNSVIPTGADHRESDGLRSGENLCLIFASDA
jgi:hypothetical protein